MKQDTNASRAKRGVYLVAAYCDQYGGDGESAIRDMLADLMHLCRGIETDFDAELYSARSHFEAELRGED